MPAFPSFLPPAALSLSFDCSAFSCPVSLRIGAFFLSSFLYSPLLPRWLSSVSPPLPPLFGSSLNRLPLAELFGNDKSLLASHGCVCMFHSRVATLPTEGGI